MATALEFYHWGAPDSTGNNYNGVDMRAEVILLSRNIVIAGEFVDEQVYDGFGGHIVTSDIMEFMGG